MATPTHGDLVFFLVRAYPHPITLRPCSSVAWPRPENWATLRAEARSLLQGGILRIEIKRWCTWAKSGHWEHVESVPADDVPR